GNGESDQEFERRTTAESRVPASGDSGASSTEVVGADAAPKGPLEAIALYKKLLAEYPQYKDSDQVLYQMARAYDELGRTEEAMELFQPHAGRIVFEMAGGAGERKRGVGERKCRIARHGV